MGTRRGVAAFHGHLHTVTDTEPKRRRCVPGQNGHLQRRNDTEQKRGPLYTTAIGKGDAGSGERHKETQESHRETQARGRVTGRRRLGGESQGDAGSGERRPFVWAPLQKNFIEPRTEPLDRSKQNTTNPMPHALRAKRIPLST